MTQKNKTVSEIFDLIETLRSPEGCPWDRKQTPDSMAKYLVEEALEAYDSIHSKEDCQIIDELGDTMFQLLFIISLYKEKKRFTFEDVVSHVLVKMISRHPHVFGEEKASDSAEVEKIWKEVKKKEHDKNDNFRSVLDSVPSGMPALMRAMKISKEAVKVGFEWDSIDGVFDKVYEEIEEFRESAEKMDEENKSMEFGDLLFTLVNVARFLNVEPESSLVKSCSKFEKRFRWMEKEAYSCGKEIESVEREDMERLWDKSKKIDF